jgi:hypothetical protein
MKRMILVIMAILAAGLTQAAQINWGTGNTYTVSDQNNQLLTASGQGYLVYLGSSGNGTVTTDSSGNWIFGNGAMVVDGTGNSSTGGQNNGFDWNNNGGVVTVGTAYIYGSPFSTGSHFELIFTSANASGTNPTTLPTTGYWTATGAFTVTAADDSGTDVFILSSNAETLNPVVNPVPEPCTMALAFVGAGAMALRRRFAKKS